jgi:integrase
VVEKIGIADDFSEGDGVIIFSFAQAQDKARAHMVRRAKSAIGEAGPLTVRNAVEAYLEFLETNRRSAVDARHRAKAHIYPALGNVEVATLSADFLRKWLADLAKAHPRKRTRPGKPQQHRVFDGSEEAVRRRRSSANRVLTILKAALNHAFHEGKTPSDAAWRKVKAFRGVDAARVRYLSLAEAKRLVNASNPEFRPLVQAALQTGCRYGELTKLRVHDFNPDSGTLAIRQSKSGKARHVVLADQGAAFFQHLCAGRAGSEIMFCNDGRIRRAGERERRRLENAGKSSASARVTDMGEWRPSEQGRPIAEASERANISPPITFHGLRHTWASHAVMNGIPLLVVAKNLGHSGTRMVERHYGHLAPSYIADAIRAGAPQFDFEPDAAVTSPPR